MLGHNLSPKSIHSSLNLITFKSYGIVAFNDNTILFIASFALFAF
jgi:hypothetical protein